MIVKRNMKKLISNPAKKNFPSDFGFVLILFFLSVIPGSIWSEERIFLKSCEQEKKTLCHEVPNAKAKIALCLLEKTDQLTEDCRTELKNYSEQMRNSGSGECKKDVSSHCRWVIPGGGRILKCLFQNEAALSEPCRKTLNQ